MGHSSPLQGYILTSQKRGDRSWASKREQNINRQTHKKKDTCAKQKSPLRKCADLSRHVADGLGGGWASGVGGQRGRAEWGRALKTLVGSSGLLCTLEKIIESFRFEVRESEIMSRSAL